MLEIVTGRTGSGKTALCLERIEEKLLGGASRPKNYFTVARAYDLPGGAAAGFLAGQEGTGL